MVVIRKAKSREHADSNSSTGNYQYTALVFMHLMLKAPRDCIFDLSARRGTAHRALKSWAIDQPNPFTVKGSASYCILLRTTSKSSAMRASNLHKLSSKKGRHDSVKVEPCHAGMLQASNVLQHCSCSCIASANACIVTE